MEQKKAPVPVPSHHCKQSRTPPAQMTMKQIHFETHTLVNLEEDACSAMPHLGLCYNHWHI